MIVLRLLLFPPAPALPHLQWVDLQQVVSVVQGGLLIIKGGEAHALEVTPGSVNEGDGGRAKWMRWGEGGGQKETASGM